MANSSQYLVAPYPKPLVDGYNSFVSQWVDKRSADSFSISIVFYGTDGYSPDGYAAIEASNAPDQFGSVFQGPTTVGNQTGYPGDDATQLTGSQQTITLNPITGLYTAMWQVTGVAAKFVRLRYTSLSDSPNLSVNVYFNCPYLSL